MKLFEDLPSQNVPFSAENLNQIQDNLVIVSATEPTGDNREKVWMQKGKNLFNKNNLLAGCRIGSDGLRFTDSDYSLTYFIPVEPNTTYIVNWAMETRECVSYYDETKKFISRNVSTNPFTTPENCKYIRASRLSTGVSTAQIEQGSTKTTYEEYIETKIHVKNDDNIYETFISENKIKELAKESIKTEKINITISDNVGEGIINCIKSGNVVVVEVSDVKIKEDKTEWTTLLASGLPKPISYNGGWIKGLLLGNKGIIQITGDGNLIVCERTGTQQASTTYTGQLVYMITD